MPPSKSKPALPKLIPIDRDYLIIMMEAGYVYLAARKFEPAMDVFEGVACLTPQSEVPHIGIGNVFAAQQRYDEALKAYRKAIKLDDQSAVAYAHMGEVLLLQDEKEKALKALHKALELETEGKAANFARALLDAVEKGVLPFTQDTLLGKTQPLPDLKKDL